MLNRLSLDGSIIDELRHAPERLSERRASLSRRARQRVHTLRGESQERLWSLQTSTLERVESLLERAHDLPVISRVTEPANRVVHSRLETMTTPQVRNYDDLNAKGVIHALRGLDRVELLKVRVHEQENKNRKTVLSAVERELRKRNELPEAA